jgi:hypothetical protein
MHLVPHFVHGHKGQRREHNLASAFNAAKTAAIRKCVE